MPRKVAAGSNDRIETTPQTGDELKAALRLAQRALPGKPYFFAIVLKVSKGVALVVDKRKITATVMDKTKKLLGANRLIRGTCRGEDGTMVFETAKPQSPTLAVIAKRPAHVHAGVKIKPVFKIVSD